MGHWWGYCKGQWIMSLLESGWPGKRLWHYCYSSQIHEVSPMPLALLYVLSSSSPKEERKTEYMQSFPSEERICSILWLFQCRYATAYKSDYTGVFRIHGNNITSSSSTKGSNHTELGISKLFEPQQIEQWIARIERFVIRNPLDRIR